MTAEADLIRRRRRHQFPDIAFGILEIGRIAPFRLCARRDDRTAGNQHALKDFIHLFRTIGAVAQHKARRAFQRLGLARRVRNLLCLLYTSPSPRDS